MYRVLVMVVLVASDGFRGLTRHIILPFVPYPDLWMYGLSTDPDIPDVVQTVAWDGVSGEFVVELEYCADPQEPLSGMVDFYGPAWELHEPEAVAAKSA